MGQRPQVSVSVLVLITTIIFSQIGTVTDGSSRADKSLINFYLKADPSAGLQHDSAQDATGENLNLHGRPVRSFRLCADITVVAESAQQATALSQTLRRR
jgi:hypothetical protein